MTVETYRKKLEKSVTTDELHALLYQAQLDDDLTDSDYWALADVADRLEHDLLLLEENASHENA